MHEMALAQSIVDLVEEHARQDGFRNVRAVHLAIGRLSNVEPRSLEFGFEVVARGTVAEGARLAIERPPGRAFCTACTETVDVEGHGEGCPLCGGHAWTVVSGDEMRVVELEVD
jgi:hydrogenase nickel incorporation protein HypA/HybF